MTAPGSVTFRSLPPLPPRPLGAHCLHPLGPGVPQTPSGRRSTAVRAPNNSAGTQVESQCRRVPSSLFAAIRPGSRQNGAVTSRPVPPIILGAFLAVTHVRSKTKILHHVYMYRFSFPARPAVFLVLLCSLTLKAHNPIYGSFGLSSRGISASQQGKCRSLSKLKSAISMTAGSAAEEIGTRAATARVPAGKVIDSCGVCDGHNTDKGCDGVCFSGKVVDAIGVCGGDNSEIGCDGVCWSGKVDLGCGCGQPGPGMCGCNATWWISDAAAGSPPPERVAAPAWWI